MEAVSIFFNDLGWLANAIGILAPLVGALYFFYSVLRPWLQKTDIDRLIPGNLTASWSADKAKSIARLAIVDDQLQDFPVNELKADGYQLQTYRQVQLADIHALSSYDIVFLDMKGIVKDDPEYGGLKLIAELRKLNSAQKICAVSGQTFDPTATEFFKQADDYKKKPITAQECKAVIDNFITESFNPKSAADQTRNVLKALSRAVRIKSISEMRKFIDGNYDVQRLSDALVKLGIDKYSRAPLVALTRMLAREAK